MKRKRVTKSLTKKPRLGRKGVSPLIASVFSIMFGIIMVAIVLTVILPVIQRARDSSTVSDIYQNLRILDSTIKEVSSEARGSKRTVSITVSDGEYRVHNTYDWIYATLEPESDYELTGRRGDVRVETGMEFMDFFNWYVSGSEGPPNWEKINGQWSVTNYKYVGTNGTTYMNITPRPIEAFEFGGAITNVSGPSGGHIFLSPINPKSLVGFWPFDERLGSSGYDYSGSGNAGALTDMNTTGNSSSGWQTATSCKAGISCLKFDEVNDYVNLSTMDVSSSEMTITAWVKADDLKLTRDHRIVSKASGQAEADHYWFLGTTNSGGSIRLMFRLKTVTTTTLTASSGDLSEGVWTHVAAVYNGSHMLLYKDAVLVGSAAKNGAIATDNTIQAWIGSNPPDNFHPFNGTIDEVKIWSEAMTQEELEQEYEMSTKKLHETGSEAVSVKTYASLVLSNPAGQTQFDDIKVTRKKNELMFMVPYSGVDLNGTMRLQKGDHRIQVEHMGTNTTSNRPVVEVSVV
jgi:type II secretory pathway pseudopilin PulG